MKKPYFLQNTKSEILRKDFVPFDDIGFKDLGSLAFSNAYTVLPEPAEYNKNRELGLEINEEYPIREAFDSVRRTYMIFDRLSKLEVLPSCYCFSPRIGTDMRKRRVNLIDCIDGARLYTYSEKNPYGEEKIRIFDCIDGTKMYAIPDRGNKFVEIPQDIYSKSVEKNGASIFLRVPSTTKGNRPYEFWFNYIPVIDNDSKNKISLSISSNCNCDSKYFIKSNSKRNGFCFHEIAGYLSILDLYSATGNRVPIEENLFVIPTVETAKFNVALENNVLLSFWKKNEQKYRKVKSEDREFLNWKRVGLLGFDETFFLEKNLNGELGNYRWK